MEENGKEGPPVFLDGLDELDRKIVRLLIGNKGKPRGWKFVPTAAPRRCARYGG